MSALDQLRIVTENEDTALANAARRALAYHTEYTAGQLSHDEYVDLMEGLSRTKAVSQQADQLESTMLLNKAIHALISVAGAL